MSVVAVPGRPRIIDRVADVVLILSVLSTVGPYLFTVGISPSWTRDLMSAYAVLAVVLIEGSWRRMRGGVLLPLTFLGCVVLGLLTWTLELNSRLSLNFWSSWFLAGSLFLFAVTLGPRNWTRWSRFAVALAGALAVYQVLGILFGGATLAKQFPGEVEFYRDRPFHANVALLLVLGFAIVVSQRWANPNRQLALALILGGSAVLSQHRSVWVALLATLIVLLLLPIAGKRLDAVIGVAAIFVMALVLPAVTRFGILPSASSPDGGLPESATSVGTMQWRLDMWRSRLNAPRNLEESLFGGVFGVTPVRWPGEGVMNPYNSAHNMLVEVSVMFGIVGVALILAIFALSLRGTWPEFPALTAFLAGLFAFGLFYSWPVWSWVILGVGFGSQARPRPARSRADAVRDTVPRAS